MCLNKTIFFSQGSFSVLPHAIAIFKAAEVYCADDKNSSDEIILIIKTVC